MADLRHAQVDDIPVDVFLEAGSDEERELRGVWLSRLMFGWMAGMPEHRGYEEWLAARGMSLG